MLAILTGEDPHANEIPQVKPYIVPSHSNSKKKKKKSISMHDPKILQFFCLFFLPFQGPLPEHMKIPRLGV